jgi:hypothetical protein
MLFFLLYSALIPFHVYFIFKVVKYKVRKTIPLRSFSGNTIVEKVLGGAAETIYREMNVTGLRRLKI